MMVCQCGTIMCYICRAEIRDYSHFAAPGPPAGFGLPPLPAATHHVPPGGKCPLFSDTDRMHEEEVTILFVFFWLFRAVSPSRTNRPNRARHDSFNRDGTLRRSGILRRCRSRPRPGMLYCFFLCRDSESGLELPRSNRASNEKSCICDVRGRTFGAAQ